MIPRWLAALVLKSLPGCELFADGSILQEIPTGTRMNTLRTDTPGFRESQKTRASGYSSIAITNSSKGLNSCTVRYEFVERTKGTAAAKLKFSSWTIGEITSTDLLVMMTVWKK